MIPNVINQNIGNKIFVQLKLEELLEQTDCATSKTFKQPIKHILPDLCKQNIDALDKYQQYLKLNYRKKTTAYNYYIHTKIFLQWIQKPIDQVTKEDMQNWKGYIIHKFMRNGNVRRITSVNHFTKYLGRIDLKLPIPVQVHCNKIVLSEQELNDYIQVSKESPLLNLIALFQVDGLIRPSEFSILKLSNMDLDNQKFYMDDTKTGNNYIILSPRLIQVIKNYLSTRTPLPGYEDYLVIIPKGKWKGRPPQPFGGFIKNQTKKIEKKAGITKYIAPYIIKPSSITNDFNRQVNPAIIQRKASHSRVETTLRYDHVSDDMVKEYFTNFTNNAK